MTPARRLRVLIAASALAVVAGYLVVWAGVGDRSIGRSDFTNTYVGATLLRQGQGAHLYDAALQAPLHARLIAPDTEGNLPFVAPPAAAVAALPFTLVGLDAAYRIFSLAQLACLILAVLIAVRAAPWPARLPTGWGAAAGLLGLAGVGSLSLLLLGQWDGVAALGLAGAYAAWRRGRAATGGALLAASALLAKPHLALGLAALLIARRDARMLAGAAAGAAGLLAAAVLAVGPGGGLDYLAHAAGTADSVTPPGGQLGARGLAVSWLGDSAIAEGLGLVGSALAVLACAGFGQAWRRRPDRLEAALAGGVALSLLASPHLLGHDLVLLAPVVVWCLAAAARGDTGPGRPAPASGRVLLLWLGLNAAAAADLGDARIGPPGRLVPLALAAAGVGAWLALRPGLGRTSLAYSGRGRGAGGVADQS